MAWTAVSRSAKVAQKIIEIGETRKKLLEQRLNWKVQEIKAHPPVNKILVAIVHEDLTLGQMCTHGCKIMHYSREIDSVENSIKEVYKPEKKKKELLSLLKSRLSNSTELFWKNQKRFLEFIDLENPERISDKASIGYVGHYSWVLSGKKNFKDNGNNEFFGKYEKYQERFRGMNHTELETERRKNWEIYNNFCITINKIALKYDSINSILIQ